MKPVAEHPGKGNSINVSLPVVAEIAYGVSGGLSGVSTLSDTSLPYKHVEEFAPPGN